MMTEVADVHQGAAGDFDAVGEADLVVITGPQSAPLLKLPELAPVLTRLPEAAGVGVAGAETAGVDIARVEAAAPGVARAEAFAGVAPTGQTRAKLPALARYCLVPLLPMPVL